jgi:hypothetical protein
MKSANFIIPIANNIRPAIDILIDFVFPARKNKILASKSQIIDTISLFSEKTNATANEKSEIPIAEIA